MALPYTKWSKKLRKTLTIDEPKWRVDLRVILVECCPGMEFRQDQEGLTKAASVAG